jgi:hypothetical protein
MSLKKPREVIALGILSVLTESTLNVAGRKSSGKQAG